MKKNFRISLVDNSLILLKIFLKYFALSIISHLRNIITEKYWKNNFLH